jgi:type II secretory pathway pseudopilin PulG
VGGVFLNEARVLLPAATYDAEMNDPSARAVLHERWRAQPVRAHSIQIDEGCAGDRHGTESVLRCGRGRGHLACPRPTVLPAAGYTVVELMFVVGLIALLAGMAIPRLSGSLDRSRGLAAARYLASRMTLARTQAVTRGRSVALRFEDEADGIAFAVYEDGNRNGVETADIQRQVDRQIDPRMPLWEQFPGVAIGLTASAPSADPVRLGRTTLMSFSPLGTATSGTIFVRGRDGTQWAVRVLGVTGRTRVLRYVPATGEWAAAF